MVTPLQLRKISSSKLSEWRVIGAKTVCKSKDFRGTTIQSSCMKHKGEDVVSGQMLSQAYASRWVTRQEKSMIGPIMSGQRSGLMISVDGFTWIPVRTLLTNLFSMKTAGAKN